MNEIEFQGKYSDFKLQMDIEIKEAAEGFVRIGYLLKVARDTNILAESGYQSVAEFAKAEYGLTKDIVSRYIAINDKYAVSGYSDQLQERYKAFGVAKLAEMLTLPDEIAEEISPEMTKKEIQEIKKDYKDEMKISDLEVLAEHQNIVPEMQTNLERALYEYFRQPEKYKEMQETYYKALSYTAGSAEDIQKVFAFKDQMVDVIAPNGIENIRVRVPGVGRLMISLNEEDPTITLTNMRTMEKEAYGWDALGEVFKKLHYYLPDWKEAYKSLYGEYPEEKVKVAPVQPVSDTEQTKTEKKHNAEMPEKTESEPVAAVEPVKPEMEQETAQNGTETEKNEPETERNEPETERNEPETDQNETEPVENEPDQEEIMPAPVENTAKSDPMAAAGEKTEEKIEVVTGEIVENTECDTDPADEARINLRIGNIKDRMLAIDGALQAKRWVTAQLAAQDVVNEISEIIAINMAAGERHSSMDDVDARR